MAKQYIDLNKSLKEIQELGAHNFNDIDVVDILHHLKGVFESVANDSVDDKDPDAISFHLNFKLAAMYVDLALKAIE